jgi:peroxiredoxin
MNTLQTQLAEFQAGFKQRATPERVATMETATANLRATGIEQSALPLGGSLPDVALTDVHGQPVRLKAMQGNRPLVVIFYRGGWCPYCNLELREWQRLLPELQATGAQLVAISPQLPDSSLSTAEKNELAYPVLSDSPLSAAHAFGLAFQMPPELVDLYRSVGHDLPTRNGNGQWVLPVPATFAFDSQGTVIYRHVEADYRLRAEPQAVLDLLGQ